MFHAAPVDVQPPHSFECEQALLGAILNAPECLDMVRGMVDAEDFAEDFHGRIFAAMCMRRDAGEAIDLRFLKLMLGDADLGGITVGEYISRIYSQAATTFNARDHAKVVRRTKQLRVALAAARELQEAIGVASITEDPAPIVAQAIETLDMVANAGVAQQLRRVTFGEAGAEALDLVRAIREGRGERGIPFGIPSLDRATLGMHPGQLIVLAARPAMGKTTVAMSFAMSAAKAGCGVGFVSLEMGACELGQRALSSLAYGRTPRPVSYREIIEARSLTDTDLAVLDEAQAHMRKLPLWVEQQPGLTVSQIAARARQMKARADRTKTPMRLLVIDHIGLIKPSARYSGNRVQEIAEITGALKVLAKELNVAVLALSQLSRNIEQRPIEDRRPILSDLRDSGSIEQDADAVIGLFRLEYYLDRKTDRTPDEDADLRECRNVIEIEILKQRQGPTPRIPCFCDIACNIVSEMVR